MTGIEPSNMYFDVEITKRIKAPAGFEPTISCLLDRRFNQLSHGAGVVDKHLQYAYNETKYMLWGKKVSPNVGLEPTTLRLRVSCSTD